MRSLSQVSKQFARICAFANANLFMRTFVLTFTCTLTCAIGPLLGCHGGGAPAYVPPPPDATLTCRDAAAAFAYGFGAATADAKERGVRDKAYKALIAAIEREANAACKADDWSDAAITCVAGATDDAALLACREALGTAWGALEASVDAALVTYDQRQPH